MKKILAWGCSFLFLSSFIACDENKDNSIWGIDKVVTFNSSIEKAKEVRVVGTTWEAGDAIGVYMVPAGKDLSASVAKNVAYSTTGGGSFTPITEKIKYLNNDKAVDFFAYYPFIETTTKTGIISLNLQQQTAKELRLMTAHIENIKESSKTPTLTFKHELATLNLQIVNHSDVEIQDLKIKLKNIAIQGEYNIYAKTLTANTKGDLSLNLNATKTEAKAIVLPMTDLAQSALEFTINGQVKEKKLSITSFEANTQILLQVNLDKKEEDTTTIEPDLEVSFISQIEDWTVVDAGRIHINFNDTTPNAGDKDPIPVPTPPISPKEAGVIFSENFGTNVQQENSHWPSVDKYKGWENVGKLSFTDPLLQGNYSHASVRQTSTLNNPHLWMAAGKNSALKIAGFSTEGYKTLSLSYEITANKDNVNQDIITISLDDQKIAVPSVNISAKNKFQKVVIENIPANNAQSLTFTSDMSTNTAGYRIDNIILSGK